jgi:hypothetical protein
MKHPMRTDQDCDSEPDGHSGGDSTEAFTGEECCRGSSGVMAFAATPLA